MSRREVRTVSPSGRTHSGQHACQSMPDPAEQASTIATAALLRSHLISQNTCAALAELRARGVRLGRPRRCPDDVLTRVVTTRAAGVRLVDICEQLNADGVLTPGGSHRWHPSHISRLLRTQDARRLRESFELDGSQWR